MKKAVQKGYIRYEENRKKKHLLMTSVIIMLLVNRSRNVYLAELRLPVNSYEANMMLDKSKESNKRAESVETYTKS